MTEYIALIHKDPDSAYSASFPDFPGAVTAAATLEELRGEAEEALALHVEGMIEDGDAIPEPSSLDAISGNPEYRDTVAVLVVRAPDAIAPAIRINITIPDPVLKRIDRYAAQHGLTRSGFLVHAAKKEMDVSTK